MRLTVSCAVAEHAAQRPELAPIFFRAIPGDWQPHFRAARVDEVDQDGPALIRTQREGMTVLISRTSGRGSGVRSMDNCRAPALVTTRNPSVSQASAAIPVAATIASRGRKPRVIMLRLPRALSMAIR
jgi:hypothetical protein